MLFLPFVLYDANKTNVKPFASFLSLALRDEIDNDLMRSYRVHSTLTSLPAEKAFESFLYDSADFYD